MAAGARREDGSGGAAAAGAGPAVALLLIVGDEELLVERAVAAAVAAAAASASGADGSDPGRPGGGDTTSTAADEGESGAAGINLHDVAAAGLTAGELASIAAPSLFGGGNVLVIRAVQDATASLAAELIKLARTPSPDLSLVVTHSGGAKNKALLADLVAAGARRVDCPAVRRFSERMEFLRAEFRRAGRKADDGGMRALLDTVGSDLRDLAAACSQLTADTTGVINQAVVARYYQGRAEATGFSVADRTCEGNLAGALEQLRWALATGTSPVLITSALASGLRTLAQVGSAGRGLSPNALAGELGMPPWKIDKARQQLRGWTADGIATAHAAVAEADVQVKGEGASAAYALERAITTIVACRGADR